MIKSLYARIAWQNIRKNSASYLPYLLTSTLSVALFYIICFITFNEGIEMIRGARILSTMLQLGIYIMAIFSLILLFYTNSFLIKQRKKELGLYRVLGLAKHHIALILCFESIYTTLLCSLSGLLIGIVFSKLIFMVLLAILKFNVAVQYYLSVKALLTTLALFGFLFALTLIYNISQVKLTNPIDLLKGGQLGEKAPRSNYLIGIGGALCLLSGYGLAITIKDPATSMILFFFCVLLVILGTYSLFTSGSILILKLLRRNKGFYYQPRNFISVSGMIHRMKQNAVGLANICILSTMVILTVSTTFSLYAGLADIVAAESPYDLSMRFNATESFLPAYQQIFDENLGDDLKITYQDDIASYSLYATFEKDQYRLPEGSYSTENMTRLIFISLSEYQKHFDDPLTLSDQDVLLGSSAAAPDQVVIDDITLRSKGTFDPAALTALDYHEGDLILVIKDFGLIDQLEQALGYPEGYERPLLYQKIIDLQGSDEAIIAYQQAIETEIKAISEYSFLIISRPSLYQEKMALNGSFLFIGIFFGFLFTMALALIIYYKQISEGYQDITRFEIMTNVGMSQDEVRRTIRKQILMVFYLPLIVALVHICFAYPMMVQMLKLFNLTNYHIFLSRTIITIILFALIYFTIYLITARTYYRLVRKYN